MTVDALVVLGAGGHGREVVSIALAQRDGGHHVRLLGVLDDGAPDAEALERLDVRHLGTLDWLAGAAGTGFVAALGYPKARRSVVARAEALGGRALTLVHPSAVLGPDVQLAEGVVVWPGVQVTTRSVFGRHTHLNVSCSLSHDTVAGDFVTVGPGARICGGVTLGDDVWVGAGATVIQGVTIGAGSVVGAGAVVLHDVAEDTVVAGVPARPLARRPEQQLREEH